MSRFSVLRFNFFNFFLKINEFFVKNLFSLATVANTIMSVPLFANLLTGATVIAFNLLLLEVSDHIDLSIATSIFNMGEIVIVTIIFCLISELITTGLLTIGDAFYESAWYRLPHRQQKLVGLAVQRGQRVFYLKGLGLIYCSLYAFFQVNFKLSGNFSENFTILKNLNFFRIHQIVKAGSSYYLMIRSLK